MAANSPTSDDRERYARAREVGKRTVEDPSAVTAARYIGRRDAIELEFAGGGTMTIPRQAIGELADAPPSILNAVTVSPAGDALAWRALDVDLYIPGLLERVFGTRMFAASSGRRGGRRTSKAKAAAARVNGAKGGRPRRQVPA
jgi:hypothetical protein